MECKNLSANLRRCNCTYEHCERKGYCCQCIEYHKKFGELPACFFSSEDERTYDRSIKKFIQANK